MDVLKRVHVKAGERRERVGSHDRHIGGKERHIGTARFACRRTGARQDPVLRLVRLHVEAVVHAVEVAQLDDMRDLSQLGQVLCARVCEMNVFCCGGDLEVTYAGPPRRDEQH